MAKAYSMTMIRRSIGEASRFYLLKAGHYGFALACVTFAFLRFAVPYDPMGEVQNMLLTMPNDIQSETSRRIEAFFADLILNDAGTQLSGAALIWLGALILFFAHPFLIVGGRLSQSDRSVRIGVWMGALSIGLVFGLGLFLVFPLLEIVF